MLFELRYQTEPKSFETSVFAERKLATNFPCESEQKVKMKRNLYITKSWSVAFNVAALTLSHISGHVIPVLFFFTYNFKTIFTNFRIINPNLIINMYNKSQPTLYLFTSTMMKPSPRPFQLKGTIWNRGTWRVVHEKHSVIRFSSMVSQ